MLFKRKSKDLKSVCDCTQFISTALHSSNVRQHTVTEKLRPDCSFHLLTGFHSQCFMWAYLELRGSQQISVSKSTSRLTPWLCLRLLFSPCKSH